MFPDLLRSRLLSKQPIRKQTKILSSIAQPRADVWRNGSAICEVGGTAAERLACVSHRTAAVILVGERLAVLLLFWGQKWNAFSEVGTLKQAGCQQFSGMKWKPAAHTGRQKNNIKHLITKKHTTRRNADATELSTVCSLGLRIVRRAASLQSLPRRENRSSIMDLRQQ